ncbi:MAG: hypothetical protein IPP12_06140 [Nitrospira sp.]|nr:hypothetical protein [Nitrospira sp.]
MTDSAMGLTDENGFLAGRIQSWIDSQHAAHRDIFNRAHDLNRDCHHFLDARAVDLDNPKQVALSLLFARSLELFQSIVVVSERGMAATTRVLHRGFIEASFHFFAIQRDPTYLDVYLDQFHIQKRKLLQRIRKSNSPHMASLRQNATDQVLQDTENAIRDAKIKTISTEEVAKRAQMHDIYLTAYAVLSHAVHTGVADIDHYIQINNATNETEPFRYGPSETETRRAICLSGHTLAEQLELVSQNFGEDRKALCAGHREAFQFFL